MKRQRDSTDDPEESARLDATSDALKWILVACFGYQGFSNSKIGAIECHEAINYYAREILLDATDTLEEHGWRVVHGIVVSLWVTPREDATQTPIRDVCATITNEVGVELEYEGEFDWVAFVPRRRDNAGALTKYFAAKAGQDEYKYRGIEVRQRSTPTYIAECQERFIRVFDESRDVDRVVRELGRCLRELRFGKVDPANLVIRNRVSKTADAYAHQTLSAVAVQRSADLGVTRSPGQDVQSVVVDDDADGTRRVRLAFEDPTEYDPGYTPRNWFGPPRASCRPGAGSDGYSNPAPQGMGCVDPELSVEEFAQTGKWI